MLPRFFGIRTPTYDSYGISHSPYFHLQNTSFQLVFIKTPWTLEPPSDKGMCNDSYDTLEQSE